MNLRFGFLLVLVVFYGCKRSQIEEFNSSNFQLLRLSEGVYACIHKMGGTSICNVGIVDNGKETIIFDSFLSPEAAEELLHAVKKLDLSPIKYVVNSHAHNDHIRGNQVFPDEVSIISTYRTAQLIAEWEPNAIKSEKNYAPPLAKYYDSLLQHYAGDSLDREYMKLQMWAPYYKTLANSYKEIQTRLPTIFVDEHLNLDGPKIKVQLISIGSGHTESDLIMYLPDEKILYTGDLVFNQMHPYMGQSSPEGWKKWLAYMNTLEISRLVPGHGDVCDNQALGAMEGYIETLESIALEMIRDHVPQEEIAVSDIPDPFDNWIFDMFYTSNLEFMIKYLSTKK